MWTIPASASIWTLPRTSKRPASKHRPSSAVCHRSEGAGIPARPTGSDCGRLCRALIKDTSKRGVLLSPQLFVDEPRDPLVRLDSGGSGRLADDEAFGHAVV